MSASLFQNLRELQLPRGDFAVFGSGPLLVRGVIQSSNDLDVLCRSTAWDTVCEIGHKEYLPEYDVSVVSLRRGAITFGTEWGIGDFDIDELIDGADIIDGLPFVQLKHVIKYKSIRRSPRDLEHLQAIADFGIDTS